jgi:hypothetical protein
MTERFFRTRELFPMKLEVLMSSFSSNGGYLSKTGVENQVYSNSVVGDGSNVDDGSNVGDDSNGGDESGENRMSGSGRFNDAKPTKERKLKERKKNDLKEGIKGRVEKVKRFSSLRN